MAHAWRGDETVRGSAGNLTWGWAVGSVERIPRKWTRATPVHSRESGNPVLHKCAVCHFALGPRFRGDERGNSLDSNQSKHGLAATSIRRGLAAAHGHELSLT